MSNFKIVLSAIWILLANLASSQNDISLLDNHIQNADLIVEAKIVSTKSYVEDGIIFTSYELDLYKQFKGANKLSSIKLVKVGGSLENEGLKVYPSIDLNNEEMGFFMLKSLDSPTDQTYRLATATKSFLPVDYLDNLVYGSIIEKHSLDLDLMYSTINRKTDQSYTKFKDIAQSNTVESRTMKINSIDHLDVCSGCGDVIKISGEGFLSNRGDFGAVLFTNSNLDSDLNSISGVNYISWSDNEIQLKVPSNAGSGAIVVRNKFFQKSPKSLQHLQVAYNIMNTPKGYEIRLIDDESDGDFGYKFQFSDETANNGIDITAIPNATNIVYKAFNHYNSHVPNFAIYLNDACPTVLNQKPANDGVNLISFDNDLWDLDMMVGDNSYGAIYMRWIKCGDSEPEVVDIDMIIRRDGDPNLMLGTVKWNFGDTLAGPDAMDFSSVIMHQLGHAMLLGHVKNHDMLMHFDLAEGESKRQLSQNDSIAASWVHTQSKAYDPPMVNCLYQFSQERKYGDYDSTQVCELEVLAIQSIELKIEKINGNSALLHFDVVGETGFGEYEIYKKTSNSSFQLIETIEAKNENMNLTYSFEDRDLEVGLNMYKIIVENSRGESIISNIKSVNVEDDNKLVILQNPVVDNILHLRFSTGLEGQLYEIFDLDGKLRMTNSFKEMISIDQLGRGMYFIRIMNGGTDNIVRFVKI